MTVREMNRAILTGQRVRAICLNEEGLEWEAEVFRARRKGSVTEVRPVQTRTWVRLKADTAAWIEAYPHRSGTT